MGTKGQPASAAVPSSLAELGLWLIRGMRKIKMLAEDFGHMEIPMSSVQNTPSGAKCKGGRGNRSSSSSVGLNVFDLGQHQLNVLSLSLV